MRRDVVPVAAFQVVPPSAETSTPATRPAASAAVPVAVTEAPLATDPPAGAVTVAVGPVVSADFVALVSPTVIAALRATARRGRGRDRLVTLSNLAEIFTCESRRHAPDSSAYLGVDPRRPV